VSAFFGKFMCLRNVSHKFTYRTADTWLGVKFEACFIYCCKIQSLSVVSYFSIHILYIIWPINHVQWKVHFPGIISTLFISYTVKNRLDYLYSKWLCWNVVFKLEWMKYPSLILQQPLVGQGPLIIEA